MPLSILEVATKLGLHLRPAGEEYKAICPMHPDTLPSLFIRENGNLWWCFSCHRGGRDAISLAQWVGNLSYNEARKFCGVEPRTLAEWLEPPQMWQDSSKRDKIVATLMLARWAREHRESDYEGTETRIKEWFDELTKEVENARS
jgi:DNA primase